MIEALLEFILFFLGIVKLLGLCVFIIGFGLNFIKYIKIMRE